MGHGLPSCFALDGPPKLETYTERTYRERQPSHLSFAWSVLRAHCTGLVLLLSAVGWTLGGVCPWCDCDVCPGSGGSWYPVDMVLSVPSCPPAGQAEDKPPDGGGGDRVTPVNSVTCANLRVLSSLPTLEVKIKINYLLRNCTVSSEFRGFRSWVLRFSMGSSHFALKMRPVATGEWIRFECYLFAGCRGGRQQCRAWCPQWCRGV